MRPSPGLLEDNSSPENLEAKALPPAIIVSSFPVCNKLRTLTLQLLKSISLQKNSA